MREYICVDDYQNTGFHLGDVMTAEEWREWAMSMNDYDEFDEKLQKEIANLPAEDAVSLIADIWQIEIVPYDKNNKEHTELRARWEDDDGYDYNLVIEDINLVDDATATGGKANSDETLAQFIVSVSDEKHNKYGITLADLNKELKECGIEPITEDQIVIKRVERSK